MDLIKTLESAIDLKFLNYTRTFDNVVRLDYQAVVKIINTQDHFLLLKINHVFNLNDKELEDQYKLHFNLILRDTRLRFCNFVLQNHYFGNPLSERFNEFNIDYVKQIYRYCSNEDIIDINRYVLLVNKICNIE
jgi:hypothetical protein